MKCTKCGRLACVCNIIEKHAEHCKYRRSATSAVAIACRHGFDVCPICDACTCQQEELHDHRIREDVNG